MSTIEIVIRTAVVMTVIFCLAVFLIMRKYGRPTNRFNGYLDVSATDASQIFQLDLETEPEDLKDLDRIILKVRKIETPLQ